MTWIGEKTKACGLARAGWSLGVVAVFAVAIAACSLSLAGSTTTETAPLPTHSNAGNSPSTSTTLLQTAPPNRWVAPSGLGRGDGSTAQDAAAIDDLDQQIAEVGPGGVIELVASEGDYVVKAPIVLRHGGGPDSPVTIRGPMTGLTPELVGDRTDPYQRDGDPGKPLFRLESGADHLQFANFGCARIGNGCFLVVASISDLKITAITASNVRRFFENGPNDKGGDATISGLEISHVDISGFSKGAIRLGHDTNQVTISDVTGDSQGQDGDNFAIGVHLTDTVHDVQLTRVTMNNATDTIHPYWNGDGFAAEPDVHNLVFVDTSAAGNTDAGYDIKASSVEMIGVIAHDNKRNFRLSGHEMVLTRCVGTDPNLRGGSGSQAQVHASGNADAELVDCTFTDHDSETIVFDIDEKAQMVVTGGSVLHLETASLSAVEPKGRLDLQLSELVSE